MGTNASIPKGTRDFAPDVVRKRTYILDTLKNILEKYGFQPLETPAIENLETLTGKYGEDGDKLIFKILNNGIDNPAKGQAVQEEWQKVLQGKSSRAITERALRYDLTVPFARFVAMNYGQLVFPFKRYQIQNVWRADRPQKGRYREFCQCDIDVAGSASLFNEVELLQIYGEAFTRLAFPDFKLVVNNRKVLSALAAVAGCGPRLADLTTALDKIDKIGLDKVTEELKGKDFTGSQIDVIKKYLSIEGSNEKRLLAARELLAASETGLQGLTELEFVLNFPSAKFKDEIVFEPALVRGLNYYTGIIFEAKPPAAVKIGSTGGGGRYDDLTSIFGVPNIQGVGISFGVDRIYDVMEELKLFPANLEVGTRVLFFNLGEKESERAFELMQRMRAMNISCELFHENCRFDKQFKYAEKKNIPSVVIIGSKELEAQTCVVKDLASGKQEVIAQNSIESYFAVGKP